MLKKMAITKWMEMKHFLECVAWTNIRSFSRTRITFGKRRFSICLFLHHCIHIPYILLWCYHTYVFKMFWIYWDHWTVCSWFATIKKCIFHLPIICNVRMNQIIYKLAEYISGNCTAIIASVRHTHEKRDPFVWNSPIYSYFYLFLLTTISA